MKPFFYSRGSKHYARFFVPTHLQASIGKRFLVFALGEGAGYEIRLKAHQLEHYLTTHLLQNAEMTQRRRKAIEKLDVSIDEDGTTHFKNILNDDDLRRAKELIEFSSSLASKASSKLPTKQDIALMAKTLLQHHQEPTPVPQQQLKGLKLIDLVDKFFLLKSHLKPSTVQAYRNVAIEFKTFLNNPNIINIVISDITRFQEHLASNKNSTRTIDNKIDVLRALFNFAITQGYYFEKNPAEGRSLLSKKQKLAGGYDKFNIEEIELIYKSSEFTKEKKRDPDFYYICTLALVTGCRVGELASLTKNDFKTTSAGTAYIRIKDAKTLAGVRSVPYPQDQIKGLNEFLNGKTDNVFKYVAREGKGAGNAVGKKFTRLLEALKLKREKLVFHSLRKFLNDYLLKNNVPYEPRCQFIGHDIDDTNVAIYSKEYSEDELSKYVNQHQIELISKAKLDI